MKKLAIISTHPIQYNAPFFKLLSQRGIIEIKVFYTQSQWAEKVQDSGFKKEIVWDLPLLDGYQHIFVNNVSQKPSTKYYSGVDCPQLIAEILAYQADAVLVFGWNLKAHWKAMRHFKSKIPVFFRGDSTLLDEQAGWKQYLRRAVLTWVYRYVDLAFYVGLENQKYFLKHGLKAKQLVYAPHAVDNDRFAMNELENESNADRLAQEYGIDRSRVGFVFAGKFEKKKNPLLLLQLAKDDHFREMNFIFVGNGELEAEMKKEAEACSNIFFIPFQNQTIMPAVYRLARFFVLPSQGPGETWGLGVNEAMACGAVPIVSDRVGCAPDLVAALGEGFVFPSNRADALRKIVEKIVNQPNDWHLWASKSKQIIAQHNYTAIAEAIEKSMLSF